MIAPHIYRIIFKS